MPINGRDFNQKWHFLRILQEPLIRSIRTTSCLFHLKSGLPLPMDQFEQRSMH